MSVIVVKSKTRITVNIQCNGNVKIYADLGEGSTINVLPHEEKAVRKESPQQKDFPRCEKTKVTLQHKKGSFPRCEKSPPRRDVLDMELDEYMKETHRIFDEEERQRRHPIEC
jgi:hypothetical protein